MFYNNNIFFKNLILVLIYLGLEQKFTIYVI